MFGVVFGDIQIKFGSEYGDWTGFGCTSIGVSLNVNIMHLPLQDLHLTPSVKSVGFDEIALFL
jgi:hypothetical protein